MGNGVDDDNGGADDDAGDVEADADDWREADGVVSVESLPAAEASTAAFLPPTPTLTPAACLRHSTNGAMQPVSCNNCVSAANQTGHISGTHDRELRYCVLQYESNLSTRIFEVNKLTIVVYLCTQRRGPDGCEQVQRHRHARRRDEGDRNDERDRGERHDNRRFGGDSNVRQ